MGFYKSFRKSGKKRQLWRAWGQMWRHTSCRTTLTQRNLFLSNTMLHLRVSLVTFILIVSTKICIYEGNRWTVFQNFLRLLLFHTMYHLIFHNQRFSWFRIMLISGIDCSKETFPSLHFTSRSQILNNLNKFIKVKSDFNCLFVKRYSLYYIRLCLLSLFSPDNQKGLRNLWQRDKKIPKKFIYMCFDVYQTNYAVY